MNVSFGAAELPETQQKVLRRAIRSSRTCSMSARSMRKGTAPRSRSSPVLRRRQTRT